MTRFYSKNREIHPQTSFGGPSCKCKSSLSLSLFYLLPLLATLKIEIDRVCRLAIHTQRRFFFLTQTVHHLTTITCHAITNSGFFFPEKISGTKQRLGVQKQGWIFSILFSLRFISLSLSLSLSYSFHSLNLK